MTTISVKYAPNRSIEQVDIDSNVYLSILEAANDTEANLPFNSLHYLEQATLPNSLSTSEISSFSRSAYSGGMFSLNTIENTNDTFYGYNSSVAIALLYDANHPDYDFEYRNRCRNDTYRPQDYLNNLAEAKKYIYNNIRFDLNKHQQLLQQGYICYEVSPEPDDYLSKINIGSSNIKFKIAKAHSNLARSVMFYSKKNHVDTIGGIPVYSGFCKNFYDYMKPYVFNINNLQDAPNISYSPASSVKRIISNVPWRTQSAIRNKFFKLDYSSTSVRVGFAADISFANPRVMELVDAIPSKVKHTIIEVPGWKTALANQDITLQPYTRSQIQKRKLNLLPFLFKTVIRDENFEPKTIYQFSLHANEDLDIRASRAIMRLADMIDLLCDLNGLRFSNPEEVRRIALERVGVLGTYAPSFFSTFADSALQNLTSAIQKNPLVSNSNNANFNDILKVPKVDDKIVTKYKKMDQVIADSKKTYSELLESSYSASRRLQDNYEQYSNYLRHLNDQKEAYEKALADFQKINRAKDQYEFFIKNLPLHQKISSEYVSSFASALENNNYLTDNFFTNIEKEGIVLRKLVFETGSRTIQFIDEVKPVSKSLVSFLEAKNSNSSIKLTKCELDIITPQKIHVDGNKNNAIYGGPYRISLSLEGNSTSMSISLLSLPALFGHAQEDSNTLYVHPHSSGISITTPFASARACLGEATALLYNAAKVADIKTVIYSILIWVRSANSADPWGRRYIHFPKENQCIFNTEEVNQNDTLEDTDVVSFLEDTFAEPENDPEEDLEETEDPEQEDDIDDVFDFAPPAREPEQIPVPQTYSRYTPTQTV